MLYVTFFTTGIPKKNRANLILGLIVVNKVGAKRPREPQVEALNPDKDQDPPTSRDSNTPGSLEHLSSFPTDVSLPFNLGGGGGAGDAGAASDEGAASDDDGINDIDLILRNNLPLRGTNLTTTDGVAGHCRAPTFDVDDFALPDSKPEVVSSVVHQPEVKPTPTTTDNMPYNGMVDGKPILSPLTPLAPPSLSFHPEEGTPLSVPPVYNTDYSPVSPATKHAFLNPPPPSNSSSQFDNFNSPAPTPYTNPPSNFSSISSNTNYFPSKFSYPGSTPPVTNQQTPQSVYPSIQEPSLVNKLDHQKLTDFSTMGDMKMLTPQNDTRLIQSNQPSPNMMAASPASNQTMSSQGMMSNMSAPVNNSPNPGGLVNTNSVNNSNVYTLVHTNVQTCVQRTEIQQQQQQFQQQQLQQQHQQQQHLQFQQQQQNGMLSHRPILPAQNGMRPQSSMLQQQQQQHPTSRQQSPMSGQQNFMALQQSQALQQNTIKQRQQQMQTSPQVQPNFRTAHPTLMSNQQAKLMAQNNSSPNHMLKNMQAVAPPNQIKSIPQGMNQAQYAQMQNQAPRLQFPGPPHQQRPRQIRPAQQGPQRHRMILPRQLSPIPSGQDTPAHSQFNQMVGQNQMMTSSTTNTQVMSQNQGQMMSQSQSQVLTHNQMMSPGYRMMSNQQNMSKMQSPGANQSLQLAHALRPQTKAGVRPQGLQSMMNIRSQRMAAAQQQAVLRQAGSPIKGNVPISSVQGSQNIYLAQQPHTFMVTNNRQPVAMAQGMAQPRFGNAQLIFPNQNGIPGQDFPRSPNKSVKTAAKRSTVKQKLKSKISNKGLGPKVKKAPKMFDGDLLLAQLEDVT